MKDNDIPAFPKPLSINPHNNEIQWDHDGMTLRQWYAALAMQGMLADDWALGFERLAEEAFKQADAMIKEGEKS